MTRWGLVATVLAPSVDVLRFAAYHLDAGAHRLYIYLDDPDADVYPLLKAHPKIRVQRCDHAFWAKTVGRRPVKHQVRQSENATHAYGRKIETDWLTHIDVDEFITSNQKIDSRLSTITPSTQCARMRPMEQLVGTSGTFKGFVPSTPKRNSIVQDIYPEFGSYIKGGFLSHVAGKLFVRTGINDLSWRIHNVFQGDVMNPNQIELDDLSLAHCHAKPWAEWLTSFRYRLEKGSYRADIPPAQKGAHSLHDMFCLLEETEGEAGLRRFYNEVAQDSPELQERLKSHDLLRHVDLDLDAKLARHFPQFR
jgi:hypothetical protein